MNAVVLTVKASYIASTKYRNKTGNKEVKLIRGFILNLIVVFNYSFKPVVQWKMRLPEKKSLAFTDRQHEINSHVQRGPAKKRLEPVHLHNEYRN